MTQLKNGLSRLLPGLLMLAMLVWLSFTALSRPLMLPDEGRYVGVAWEMVTSGNWLVPHLDGMPYFHKPPLFYWLTAASLKLWGAHLLASRFASLLGASVLVIGLWWFLNRHLGRRVALLSCLVLLTQPFFFAGAQFANLDMLVASMISLTILLAAESVWQMEQQASQSHFLLGMYVFAAAGVLAKGLIGIALPGVVILTWLAVTQRLHLLVRLFFLPGILVFLGITLPWFLLMEQHYHGFLNYFFIHHHFQRFTGTDFNNQQPFWFYVPALLLLTLPSSLWLLRLRLVTIRQWPARQQEIVSLLLCWTGAIVVFFSIPLSKPLGYIMPVLPALAALSAMAMLAGMAATTGLPKKVIATLCLSGLVCVSALLLVNQRAQQLTSYQLGQQLQSRVATGDRLVMLDKYQFDLPFYLKLAQPAWVINSWQSASGKLKDSWKKELIEAKAFDPSVARQQLLTDSQLSWQLCQERSQHTLWLTGRSDAVNRFSILRQQAPVVQVGDHEVWQLTPQRLRQLCTPTSIADVSVSHHTTQ